MVVLNLLFYLFVILWLVFLWSRRKFYLLCIKFPGPLGYPLIGLAHKLTKREDILKVFLDMEREYGHICLSWLGTVPFLIVAEPNLTETILTSPDFINKACVYEQISHIIGYGLFSLPYPLWNVHRKLINPAFSHKVLLSFVPIFNSEAINLQRELSKLVGQEESDLTDVLQKFTLNLATQTTMGKQVTSINDNEDVLHSYRSMLETVTRLLFSPWLKYKAFFRMTANYTTFLKSKQCIHNFIRNLIAEKVVLKSKVQNMSPHDDTNGYVDIKKNPNIFIDRAMELVETNEFNWQDVEAESNVMVLAAFETTSNTIGYTLMLLAMFPKYQEKLFEEIVSIIPQEDTVITYEDIKQMTYMDMVLNETMRIIAPVPLIARQAMRDVKLDNGIVLPKGLQVAIDIFNMHRNPEYWGSDSTIFNPEHFLPANTVGKHPYVFIPFTKGIRNCIGSRYALVSMKITLAKILRRYYFTTTFRFSNLQFVEDISIKLKNNPLLQVHLRQS